MAGLLIRLFADRGRELSENERRERYGTVCGILGIFLNAVLFGAKLAVGLISGSVAITADAFNNLSDAGSSVVTLVGFRLSAKRPDREHPFGHGRIEYLSGFLVSLMIVLMGVELIQSSIEKISSPGTVSLSAFTVAVMLVGIAVKIYMFAYNRKYGRLIDSSAMKATSVDSLSDAMSSAAVLLSGVISHLTGNGYIDIVCGMLVSLVIIKAGISAANDTVSPLLGRPASAETVRAVESITLAHGEILGIHDLVVHDYGPGRVMVSLHAEVSAKGDILKLHDVIDNVEGELNEKLGCEAVIHMDPIDTEDARINAIKQKLEELALSLDGRLMVHDLRAVYGDTHTNLIFDLVVPSDAKRPPEEYSAELSRAVSEYDPLLKCVIKLDRSYTDGV